MQSWVIGNWKQNPQTLNQAKVLMQQINQLVAQQLQCQLMVAPSSLHLNEVAQIIKDTDILLAAQDVSGVNATTGAFTGDTSAAQLKDIGADWVIIGHSERRKYYQESNELFINKCKNGLEQDLGIIYCIGETQAQREQQQTLTVINEQLTVIDRLYKIFSKNTNEGMALNQRIIIAYEPVWAIGTGLTPTADEVNQVHEHIRTHLLALDAQATIIPIVYGGSVNAKNANEFAKQPQVNGALVGGAALKADSFIKIAHTFGS